MRKTKNRIDETNIKNRFLCTIRFSAFDANILKKNRNVFEKILFLFEKKNCLSYKNIGQPTRLQTITLLRSPHIDKKSREQFYKKSYKHMFLCSIKTWKGFELLVSLIQKTHFRGVFIDCSWEYCDWIPTFEKKGKQSFLKPSDV
jgi:small subunit ribosomal protein S10